MNITILFGAKSFEHEISIVSAIAMKKVLRQDITYIFCDYGRDFYLIPAKEITSKRFSSGEYKKDKKVYPLKGGFYTKSFTGFKKIESDIVLNLIHGQDGEDGKIAGLLDFFDINYIGPRVEASVISYNKLFTKLFAKEIGVKTLDYQVIYKNEDYRINIPYPFIVKPLRLGSSIGISVVKEENELEYALESAFEYDNSVLIEPFIDGIKEYNLAGYKADKFYFSIIEEPLKKNILDFDKKYLDFSRTKKVNEADISEDLGIQIKNNFEKIYYPVFEGSIIRCDFFVHNNDIYLNEINPVPGSMANYLFDNFDSDIKRLSSHLPKSVATPKGYKYIHQIQSAKGK